MSHRWDKHDATFGVAELRLLATHFKTPLSKHGFSIEMAVVEWKALMKLVHR